jgi:hypothetical protein
MWKLVVFNLMGKLGGSPFWISGPYTAILILTI